MPLDFAGPATPLDEDDIAEAAKKLDCEVAAVRAVVDVESRGGFLADGRPKILFERHYFSADRTPGRGRKNGRGRAFEQADRRRACDQSGDGEETTSTRYSANSTCPDEAQSAVN